MKNLARTDVDAATGEIPRRRLRRSSE